MPSSRFAPRPDTCENDGVDAADLRYGLTLSGADPAAIGKEFAYLRGIPVATVARLFHLFF